MPRYTVLDRVHHDGTEYEAGAAIALPETEAAPLIAVGVIMAEAPETTERPPEGGEGQGREAALLAAIAGLEKGNPDHWTRDGKPEVRALRAATGLGDIGAAERDAAWDAHPLTTGDAS